MNSVPERVFMVRPSNFGFNPEAAKSNAFQSESDGLTQSEIAETARQEFQTMLDNLTKNGVKVTVFEDTETPIKPDAVFPNNWISFMPDGRRILYPMCVSTRRAEIRPEIFNDATFGNSEIVDLRHYVESKQYLEGTGSIVFHHPSKLAFACRSCRTHDAVLNDLCQQIGYEAVIFDAKDETGMPIYHTNVILSVGDGWSAVCSEFIDQADSVLEKLEKIGRIFKLDSKSIAGFSGNCFEVKTGGQKNALIISESGWNHCPQDFQEFVSDNLVLCKSDIPIIEKLGGGSARCMVAGIYF